MHEHHKNNAKDDRIAFDHRLYALGENTDGTTALYRITVEDQFADPKHPSDKRFHNLKYIQKVADNIDSLTHGNRARGAESASDASATKYSVADIYDFVKRYDSDFNAGREPSKVVDNHGAPKIMYRGDASEFYVFDRKKARSSGAYGGGFYFTDSPSHAGQYGTTRQFYLSVQNPLQFKQHKITRAQMRNFLKAVRENEDYDFDYYGQDATVAAVLKSIYGKGDLEMLQDVSATAIGDLVEAVELFNQINGTKYDGIIAPTETVVFDSRQIKSATDNVGTFDRNNPDVRYSERDYSLPSDQELMENAAEYLSEAGGEEYWNALLESAPELADDREELRELMKANRAAARKLAETEAKLAEAKRQLTTTNRKLNTRGIAGLSQDIMKALGASDAKNRGVVKQLTQILTEAYHQSENRPLIDPLIDVDTRHG